RAGCRRRSAPTPRTPAHRRAELPVSATPAREDVMLTAAKATAAAVAVAALAFGLWKVRSVIILLILALTFAAAIRPGVDWLRRRRIPEPIAISVFFVGVLGAFAVFCWL